MADKKAVLSWLQAGENVVQSGFANKIGFWGGPGGQLVLTNQRLVFTNRSKQKIIASHALDSIIMAASANSATIWTIALLITIFIRNSVRVSFNDGGSQRYVVNKRDTWIGLINEWRVKGRS
jgi:hypothetical protein